MSNAYNVVKDFEKELSRYTGAPYVTTVNSCSSALFLCCLYCNVKKYKEIIVPKITYPSVAHSIINAGGRVKFVDKEWQHQGWFRLEPTKIYDSAKRLCKNMYMKETFICLSFHGKKCIKIGRGGAILTDNKKADSWFKRARFDGRGEVALADDKLTSPGWNVYMDAPEAARGLVLMQFIKDYNVEDPNPYQDLSKYSFFRKANRGK